MFFSMNAKSFSSRITPHLIASASPFRICLTGSVFRKCGSMKTADGWWKVPNRFLPAFRFTPVFPPVALSVMATNVVGIWT